MYMYITSSLLRIVVSFIYVYLYIHIYICKCMSPLPSCE